MAVQGNRPPIVGIDLGGTKILAAVVDGENRILSRAKRSTPAKQGNDAILNAIVSSVDEALAEAQVSREQIAAVGIGSPGPLDPKRGVIPFSPNLEVRDFALGPDLSRILGHPVMLQNDVSVGGYGEFRLGAGRGYHDLIAAFVGTGVGGCVILDGRLREGLTGNAGEIGHIVVKAKGPRCGCGQHGCLEALASRTAIARRIRKAIRKGADTKLSGEFDLKSNKIKSKDLAAAYNAGDPLTVHEVHRAANYLGLALGSLINVLGPEIVIVGGGVAVELGETFLEKVRLAAREQVLADPEGKTRIELAALGDDAGILGAALMAREQFAPEG